MVKHTSFRPPKTGSRAKTTGVKRKQRSDSSVVQPSPKLSKATAALAAAIPLSQLMEPINVATRAVPDNTPISAPVSKKFLDDAYHASYFTFAAANLWFAPQTFKSLNYADNSCLQSAVDLMIATMEQGAVSGSFSCCCKNLSTWYWRN